MMSDPLGGKSWDELEVSRHESGKLMFRDQLRKRNERGQVESIPVRVRVPGPEDSIAARVEARVWFASLKGLDADRDKDLFGEMEQICLLARAIRTDKAPHPQLCTGEELASYDEASLHDLQERINAYKALLDPRVSGLDEQAIWNVIAAVAQSGNLLPLVAIAGHEQASCIVRMARQALLSPTAKSYVPSLETLTQALSLHSS